MENVARPDEIRAGHAGSEAKQNDDERSCWHDGRHDVLNGQPELWTHATYACQTDQGKKCTIFHSFSSVFCYFITILFNEIRSFVFGAKPFIDVNSWI